MSQRCPRCGLYNPPQTIHCDCGHYFLTKDLARSNVVPQVSTREVDLRALRKSSRADVQSGIALLALAAVLTIVMFLAGGRIGVSIVLVVWGVVRLVKGLEKRRASAPDRDPVTDTMPHR